MLSHSLSDRLRSRRVCSHSSGCREARRDRSQSHGSRYRSRDRSPLSSDRSRSRERSLQPGWSRRDRVEVSASQDRVEISASRDCGNSGSRVEPAPAVTGSSAPLPMPSLQDLRRLFFSLSGPFAQRDVVGASLFAAAGIAGAAGPAAPVTPSVSLACTSGSVPASGGMASASAASVTGSSSRHERALESPALSGVVGVRPVEGGPVRVRRVAGVGPLPCSLFPFGSCIRFLFGCVFRC